MSSMLPLIKATRSRLRANRLAVVLDTVTREEYMMITVDDLEEAANMKESRG